VQADWRLRWRAALGPSISDVGFLGDLKRIVDLDSEIAYGGLNLGMAKRLGFILRIS
jgi:hypothetical protein